MDRPRLGFLGIGIMGAPMAEHLAKAGYSLTIYDRNRSAAEAVARRCEGVAVGDSPKAVASASDIVVTMLPSGESVREVALGREGLLEGFGTGALLLDTSSSEPWLTVATAEALAGKGVDMVDAPVSGAQAGALAAELVFMVGGAKDPVARATPLLQVLGKQVFHLGPLGAGHAMKSINNLITAMTFMVTAEGLAMGKHFGLDPDVMTDVLNVSTGMSWISQTHIRQRITNRKFDDPFRLALMIKDIGIALELANQQGLPLPLCGLGQHLWKAAGLQGDERSSISDMVRWVERMTGTTITAGSEPGTSQGGVAP